MSENSENNRTIMLLGEIKGIVESLREGQRSSNDQISELRASVGEVHSRVSSVMSSQAAQEKSIDALQTTVTSMDVRLRDVEVRGATYGAVSGGAVAVGMALLVEGLKAWMSRGGH